MILGWLRRRRARARPFPEEWRTILREGAPFYGRLGADAKARFEETLKVLVLTKHWVGAKGMVVDDRVRVLVAAAAARLSMNLRPSHYPRLTEIVVHPTHYLHEEGGAVIFGEAHHFGTVVLSWDAVVHGLTNPGDGQDTALHEFAHVLDAADGSFDGTPYLPRAAYAPWAAVMSKAFLALRDDGRRRNVLRRYGATNEAEFFAVASETFFEKPRQLRKKQPELYAILAEYYASDPAAEEEGAP